MLPPNIIDFGKFGNHVCVFNSNKYAIKKARVDMEEKFLNSSDNLNAIYNEVLVTNFKSNILLPPLNSIRSSVYAHANKRMPKIQKLISLQVIPDEFITINEKLFLQLQKTYTFRLSRCEVNKLNKEKQLSIQQICEEQAFADMQLMQEEHEDEGERNSKDNDDDVSDDDNDEKDTNSLVNEPVDIQPSSSSISLEQVSESSVSEDFLATLWIFGLDDQINHLLRQTHWYMDATFFVCPTTHAQFFTVNSFYGDKLIPAVYVLMSHKYERLYDEIFIWLKSYAVKKSIKIEVTHVMCDFEDGLRNSVSRQFNGVIVNGCWYHYCAAVFRWIKSNGMIVSLLFIYDP